MAIGEGDHILEAGPGTASKLRCGEALQCALDQDNELEDGFVA